ncbi:hypothetical protein CRENBAI_014781 [Crenichthys baileyi]|uniref:Uncharacterized protein n=1 Tax=Crenichthys baileyi TaxID=28760 RepID=A0AAV9QST8_9TELE
MTCSSNCSESWFYKEPHLLFYSTLQCSTSVCWFITSNPLKFVVETLENVWKEHCRNKSGQTRTFLLINKKGKRQRTSFGHKAEPSITCLHFYQNQYLTLLQ